MGRGVLRTWFARRVRCRGWGERVTVPSRIPPTKRKKVIIGALGALLRPAPPSLGPGTGLLRLCGSPIEIVNTEIEPMSTRLAAHRMRDYLGVLNLEDLKTGRI